MRAGSKIFVALMIFILCACNDDFSAEHTGHKVKTYKVAVVMPKERQEAWTRTAQWALDNLAEAQAGLSEEVKLGIYCPVCKGFIPVELRQLLFGDEILCPDCGYSYSINRGQSEAALEALRKVEEAIENLRKTGNFK